MFLYNAGVTNMTARQSNPIYRDESAAREYLEALRWPEGPICPHCGSVDNAVRLKGVSTRPGVWKCRDCRKPFSAMIGTMFERSKIPLAKWLLASHLLSEHAISTLELQRAVGVTYKSAWLMARRIRRQQSARST